MVSIVIPVYNVKPYLRRCVESVLKQTYQDFEAILVDDGSIDGSSQICDEYLLRDSKIRVIHKENGGLSDARNTGIRAAKGEYILFVDSDDFLDKNALELLTKDIRPDVDIVTGGYKKIIGNKMVLFTCNGIEAGKEYSPYEYLKRVRIDVVAWGNLFRRQYLLDNDLFFRKGFIHEDNEIFPRLYLNAEKIVGTAGHPYNYVIREGSIQTNTMSTEREKYFRIIFRDWLKACSEVKDEETREALYNYMITTYLNVSHDYHIRGWIVKGLDLKFVLQHTDRTVIMIKAIMFTYLPELYFRVRVTKRQEMLPLDEATRKALNS